MIKVSVKQIAESRPTEVLKNYKNDLQQKILDKQMLIRRRRERISQLEKDCADIKEEYKIIDRVIFLRENSITKLSTGSKKDKKSKALITKRIEDLPASEASELLQQLLAIQARKLR